MAQTSNTGCRKTVNGLRGRARRDVANVIDSRIIILQYDAIGNWCGKREDAGERTHGTYIMSTAWDRTPFHIT